MIKNSKCGSLALSFAILYGDFCHFKSDFDEDGRHVGVTLGLDAVIGVKTPVVFVCSWRSVRLREKSLIGKPYDVVVMETSSHVDSHMLYQIVSR